MIDIDGLTAGEAPAFFDRQRLMAADLAAAQARARELAWLHNRSLHGWGIAAGFAVSGPRGARSVRVLPGYALDANGRELVLGEPLQLPIPAVEGAGAVGHALYYLTACYAEVTGTVRSGACGSAGAVRMLERPTVRWQDPANTEPSERYRYGLDVVLAEIHVRNCELLDDVSAQGRRDAAPPQQPYVAAGRTQAGATLWRLWPSEAAAQGVVTIVPTSQAGFQATPCYQAHVAGERMAKSPVDSKERIVDGQVQIAQATASSFELRVILPAGTTVGTAQAYRMTRDDYMGIAKRPLGIVMGGTLADQQYQLLRMNGPRLFVGQQLLIYEGPDARADALTRAEFETQLTKIATSQGTTLAQLLGVNGFDPDKLSLAIGQVIALPGDSLPLNPPDVFKPEFAARLQTELRWHVVWSGVEG